MKFDSVMVSEASRRKTMSMACGQKSFVGDIDGDTVGAREGLEVVGDIVGETVGEEVGDTDGLTVGVTVGDSLGASVGLSGDCVGETVGESVWQQVESHPIAITSTSSHEAIATLVGQFGDLSAAQGGQTCSDSSAAKF